MIEDIILTRGGNAFFQNIIKIYKGLTIKLIKEANMKDTASQSYLYRKYRNARLKYDDFETYKSELDLSSLKSNCPTLINTDEKAQYYLDNLDELTEQTDNYNEVLQYLDSLRKTVIDSYIETNEYYTTLMGIPNPNTGIIIKIIDRDLTTDLTDIDNIIRIPAHEVVYSKKPQTYNNLYILGGIDALIKENPDIEYLKYMKEPIDILKARESEQFDILRINDIEGIPINELENFYKAWNEVVKRMKRNYYVEDFEIRYNNYETLMFYLILFNAFSKYCSLVLNRYSVRNYSREELYSILDSYNLSNLNTLSDGTLAKIIDNIYDLIGKKGTEEVFNIILEIVGVQATSVRRYSLEKIYKIGQNRETFIDIDKGYYNNFDIKFTEKSVTKSEDRDLSIENIVEYDEITKNDLLWGGVIGLPSESANSIKKQFKHELMREKFSKIATKYFIVSYFDVLEDYHRQINDHLGLLFQIEKNTETKFLHDTKIEIDGETIVLDTLLVLIYWGMGTYYKIPNIDTIDIKTSLKDLYSVTDSMIYIDSRKISYINSAGVQEGFLIDFFNKNVKLPYFLNNKYDPSISPPIEDSLNITNNDIYTYHLKHLEDYKEIDFQDYIIKFNKDFGINTWGENLKKDIESNKQIISKINDKIFNSKTYYEYIFWKNVYDISVNDVSNILIASSSDYDPNVEKRTLKEYLEGNTPDLYKKLYGIYHVDQDKEKLFNKITEYADIIRKTINEKSDGSINIFYNKDLVENIDSILEELKTLMDEFSSMYSELHTVVKVNVFSDYPYNSMNMFYENALFIEEELQEYIEIKHFNNINYIDEKEFLIKMDHILEDPYTHMENDIDMSIQMKYEFNLIYEYSEDYPLDKIQYHNTHTVT